MNQNKEMIANNFASVNCSFHFYLWEAIARSAVVKCSGDAIWCPVMLSYLLGSSPVLFCHSLRYPVSVLAPTECCSGETPGLSSQPRPGSARPPWQPTDPGFHSEAGWTERQSPGLPGCAGRGSSLHPAAFSRSHEPPAAERPVLSHRFASWTLTPPAASASRTAEIKRVLTGLNRKARTCPLAPSHPHLLLEKVPSSFGFS